MLSGVKGLWRMMGIWKGCWVWGGQAGGKGLGTHGQIDLKDQLRLRQFGMKGAYFCNHMVSSSCTRQHSSKNLKNK